MKVKGLDISISRTKYINKKNRAGLTALHFSAFRGNVKMIKFLVRRGADTSVKDIEGKKY